MKNNVCKLGIWGVFILLFVSCKTTTPLFYANETECLGVEMDGSQTLKAWGKGKGRADAAQQAKKNAVRDVLFKGNFTGSKECNFKALILEVNAQEKYEDYFNAFFKDGGEYENYVSLKDERLAATVFRGSESRNKDQSTYSVVVRVLRVELKEKLIKDGILKQ
jgi:hypothetical protein